MPDESRVERISRIRHELDALSIPEDRIADEDIEWLLDALEEADRLLRAAQAQVIKSHQDGVARGQLVAYQEMRRHADNRIKPLTRQGHV